MSLYDWAYLAAAPFVLPVLGYRRLARGKYRESGPAMLGRGPQWIDPKPYPNGTIWMHAVSAGEVIAAKAVAAQLKCALPDWPLVASTITETGQAAARRTLNEAEEIFYFPLDLSWNVRRFIRRFQPRVAVLFEAELWPNFLLEADSAGARAFLLNGRVSERSFRRYRKVRPLIAGPIQRIRAFCMQTEADAARMEQIIGRRDNIFVTGNCKFDAEFPTLTPEERNDWRQRLGIDPQRPLIVAGSTHPGEEEIVLAAYGAARKACPDLALILAPRHPERFEAVAALLKRQGLAFRRAACAETAPSPQVVLLDTMGQLAKAYGLGSIAVVGGSFVRIGGHNLLEAAAHSIPVVYGPHMRRQPDMLRLIGQGGGGLQVQPAALGKALAELLSNEPRRRDLGRRARQTLDENRGSAGKMVEIVRRYALGDVPT